MKSEFTPGPWEQLPETLEIVSVSASDAPVASVHRGTGGREARATARLIAAAPELLASLTWITEFCEEHPDWFGAEDGAEGEWLKTARAAITKATGGQ